MNGDLCKHLGIDSSPDRYSNLFLHAYINRHVRAKYLKMILFYCVLEIRNISSKIKRSKVTEYAALSLDTQNVAWSLAKYSQNIQATSKGSDQTARTRRLIWGSTRGTYHIVGNLMSHAIYNNMAF